jgi:hypothetical protein
MCHSVLKLKGDKKWLYLFCFIFVCLFVFFLIFFLDIHFIPRARVNVFGMPYGGIYFSTYRMATSCLFVHLFVERPNIKDVVFFIWFK